MKKKLLGMTLLTVGITLCGCASTRDESVSVGIQQEAEEQETKEEESKEEQEVTTVEETTTTEETETETTTETEVASTTNPNKEFFEAFLADEMRLYVGGSLMNYSDFTDVDESTHTAYLDADNDGEDELIIYYIYDNIIVDVEDSQLVVLATGEGTSGYLSVYDIDGEAWICHSDTTHTGRHMYQFTKYNGFDNEVDSFDLSEEHYENNEDKYDENSTFTYKGESISMEEYEELVEKYTENMIS